MVKFYYQIKTEPKKTAMDTITKREELYEKEKDCINDFSMALVATMVVYMSGSNVPYGKLEMYQEHQ